MKEDIINIINNIIDKNVHAEKEIIIRESFNKLNKEHNLRRCNNNINVTI